MPWDYFTRGLKRILQFMIRLIAAIDRTRGIAKRGYMPWNIPEDLRYFSERTKAYGGAVLVGGATYRMFSGPLTGRQTYVLTRDPRPIEGITPVHDLQKLLDDFRSRDLWVAGGAEVFSQVMRLGRADELYLTKIDADFGCDKFFPDYESEFQLSEKSPSQEQNGFVYVYSRYIRTSLEQLRAR